MNTYSYINVSVLINNSDRFPTDAHATEKIAAFLRKIAETRKKVNRGEVPNLRISRLAGLDS